MTEFTIQDGFVDPRTVSLKTMRGEVAAGNPYAALVDMWIRLGGYERGLEDGEFAVGTEHAFSNLSIFLENYKDVEHSAYPLLVAALGLLEYENSPNVSEKDRFAKLLHVVPLAIVTAVLNQADQGSYHGKILGSMLIGGKIHVERDLERIRDLLEQLPGLSSEPPTSTDPIALYELAGTYTAMDERASRYTIQQRAEFRRRATLRIDAAARLGHLLAMPEVAGYYLQQPAGFSFLPEITDPAIRLERAEHLFRLCIKQGLENEKLGLAIVHEARGDLEEAETEKRRLYEEAKRLFRERSEAGDVDATLALVRLHDRLREYSEAHTLILKALTATTDLPSPAEDDARRTKAWAWLYTYHSRQGKPGVEKSDQLALLASESLLDLHRQGRYDFNPGEKHVMEAVNKAIWARAWIRDEKEGFRRARKIPRPIPSKSIPPYRYKRLLEEWRKTSDDAIDGFQDFIILPENPIEALTRLIAETPPAAVISNDLASELFNRAQIWIRDAVQGLRLAARPDDIIKHPLVHAILPEQSAEALPLLRAEAETPNAVISASFASAIAKLYAVAGDAIEAHRWQLAAAERNSVPDMQDLIALYYDAGPEQDWIQALQWSRRALGVSYKDGGLRGKQQTDVQRTEKTILRTRPPRVWGPEADGTLRPLTNGDQDLAGAVFVAGDENALLAWCIEGPGRGSGHATQIAVDMFAARNETNQVWVNDATVGYLRPFMTGDDVAHAVFVPLDRELAIAFLGARAAEAAERETAALIVETELEERGLGGILAEPLEETQADPARKACGSDQEIKENEIADAAPVAEAPEAILARHLEAASNSVLDALEAGRLFFEAANFSESERMYEMAIQSGDIYTILEVAERHAQIKHGATKDMEIAAHLYNFVREQQRLPSDQATRLDERLAPLCDVLLEEAWTTNTHGILRRVRHSVFPDMEVDAAKPLLVYPPNAKSLDDLLEHRRTSMDAAAETALRLARGIGCEPDLPEAFRQLSNLLLDRREFSPRAQSSSQEPNRAQARDFTQDAILKDSPKRAELQSEWDRLAAITQIVLRNGAAQLRTQGFSAVGNVRSADVAAYRTVLNAGNRRYQDVARAEAA
jgi:TPR repeat protein